MSLESQKTLVFYKTYELFPRVFQRRQTTVRLQVVDREGTSTVLMTVHTFSYFNIVFSVIYVDIFRKYIMIFSLENIMITS